MELFDAIIIGSGQGGTPLAKKLAKAGFNTAIIEKRFVGGTCINDGCTPTKAMIASARRAFMVRNSDELGVHSGECTVDFKFIRKRKDDIIQTFRNGTEKGLVETPGVTLIFGDAAFTGTKELEITNNGGEKRFCRAELIFINTGLSPDRPDIEGIDAVKYLDSTSVMDLEELPSHLAILGGSYIALEFGQMFRRFGSKVSIIERSSGILKHEDEDIVNPLRDILLEEGIEIFANSVTTRLSNTGSGDISISIDRQGERHLINASHLLVATGRTPQTRTLGLEKTGVKTSEQGFIEVDEFLQTAVPGIYAMGDVKGGPAFTHISYNDYLVLLNNVTGQPKISIKGRLVPYTVFTDPQLGRIGITEKEAEEQKLNIRVATITMDKVARGIETGETKGLMKAVVDADSEQILGVAILAAEGGEIMSVLQMAMVGKITYPQVREMIFAHPLYSESLNNLFMSLDK